jgi:nucleotide-binding universal stress UspA family protein
MTLHASETSAPDTHAHGIVVAYDGSPGSDLAVAWAASAAVRTGETVSAVIVSDAVDVPHSHSLPEPWWHEIEDRARTQLAGAGVQSARVERRTGPTAATLLDAANTATMLVVGTRAHGRVAEIVLGSVGHAAARRAHCPVVVVRPQRHPGSRRIVAGVDGSPSSLRALDFACREAASTGDTVAVVRAWKPGTVPIDKHGDVPSKMSTTLRHEEEILNEVVARARAEHQGIAMEADFIATDPARALVDASARARLVVVGTRGLTVVERAVLGSVSHHVLHHAQCPVAVVH